MNNGRAIAKLLQSTTRRTREHLIQTNKDGDDALSEAVMESALLFCLQSAEPPKRLTELFETSVQFYRAIGVKPKEAK